MNNRIVIKGAREHNLKNVDLELPRDKLIVMTGLSGSGKSSLAFDTIYAEGQRRYVESLSSYARQFLGQMDKPDVDYIDGLSPAISIDQKTTSRNPRSTVGTVTEIYDYLRLLYARVGTPHCPECGREITQQTVDQIVDKVRELPERTRIQVLAPVIRGRKGEYRQLLEDMLKQGFMRARIDGRMCELEEPPKIAKNNKHTIEIVVDRLAVRADMQKRLTDSLETAMKLAGGLVVINVLAREEGEQEQDLLFSQNYACPDCGISIEELTPRMFSFNNPYGACPTCSGLGTLMKFDPAIVIPDRSLSLNGGAIAVSNWSRSGDEDTMSHMILSALAKHYAFSLDTPICELPEGIEEILLYGTKGQKIKIAYERESGRGEFMAPFEGIITNLERRYRETQSEAVKESLEDCMSATLCPVCNGQRLKREALAVTVGGISIAQLCEMPVVQARGFVRDLKLSEKNAMIAGQILREIDSRLGFLNDVGLSYLTLSRAAATLSGGEAQRIRLATQIGSSLMGVLYILDEPSIGLHQRDNQKLLGTLRHLRDLGNTLVVVEHDEETMRAADHLVDIGPGAGENGGRVIASGTVEDIIRAPESITGAFLSGRRKVAVPEKRRTPTGWLKIKNARANNLKGIDVRFPLGVISCVTGVSGSGKSSLVNEILFKRLSHDLNRSRLRAGAHDGIEGIEQLDKIIAIDQSPIGRSPRSNPATYTGVFDLIREVFAATTDAKTRGYKPNRFSFNVKGGRCEACAGDGILKIEMHFLPDVYVPCDVCKGRRYNRETLEVRYKGKNIFEVLDMTVDEAVEFFAPLPRIAAKLQTLKDVGLGYIKIGQPSTTLSGGEAQRIKLATELSRKATGRTLYVLDEPTTGLHMADVQQLDSVLQKLADAGNTLVVIEHNLDVIKTADHIIDMGPEGGDQGGTVIAEGTPEQVAECEGSYTGLFLRPYLA
ncbi:MAG: excinuclease ABC subunit UvrA [Eubacteriales bacterium]|nr:excinuclease ABC subunit UvrA [Eubacteriales bacterium]